MIKRRHPRNQVMEKSNCWREVLSIDVGLAGRCGGT
jgi:hypothetical protein